MARLLEHHALDILKRSGISVPSFQVVFSPEEAKEAALRFNGKTVLKPLIPVGGRGKAGAIRTAQTPERASEHARELLGRTILNFAVDALLVSEFIETVKEFFVSLTFDSMSRKPLVLFSSLGGIDVETILEGDPERLIQRPIRLSSGLRPFVAREIAEAAGLKGNELVATADVLVRLYRIFRESDAEIVEVNPLVLTSEGGVVALSAVIVIDNQALFRHPELNGIADPDRTNGWRPLTALERDMRAIDRTDASSAIRFNELEEGKVAFMMTGGGAGLLALDCITKLGGEPATTFDITPGRVEEKMYRATKAILSKPGLKGMIAGGNITNFIPIDIKVRGVVRALKELRVNPTEFPVVFRFAGPGVEEARRLAAQLPGIEFFDAASSLEDAVSRIVELTKNR
jgi:succinyl-CoA synthetase beta subunit/citryl-CoA synthetase large subunit